MKTIHKLILIAAILLHSSQLILCQDCSWSYQAGGTDKESITYIVTDLNGNSYIGGKFRSDLFYTNSGTWICYGVNDLFLIKLDPSGNEIWTLRFGGPNVTVDEQIGSITLDTLNSRLLITGSFYNTLTLLDTVLSGYELTVFVMAMDFNGQVLWARAAGGNGEDRGYGIAYDSEGNIYISGINSNDAFFDQTVVPRGGFLAKYDKDGNLLWAKNKFQYMSSTYTFTEAPPWNLCFYDHSLIVNGDANRKTIIIDTIVLTLSIGFGSTYIASFSTQGDIEWLKSAGAPDGSSGTNISCDHAGNIYVIGTLWGSIGIFGDDTLHSSHGDCFIAKYSPDGNYQWAKGIQPSGFARGLGISSDGEGNIYFTGTFKGYGHFGSYLLYSDATSIDTMNIFLARYSGEGECIGVRQYSKGSSTVTVDQAGDVFLGGAFLNELNIGPQLLISRGKSDVFTAKCSPITGIIQPKETTSNTLLIYANPNTGECKITIPDEFLQEKALNLEVYDQTGRLIQKARVMITASSVEIDIRAQAKGLYHAILSNGKKSYSGKIVFE